MIFRFFLPVWFLWAGISEANSLDPNSAHAIESARKTVFITESDTTEIAIFMKAWNDKCGKWFRNSDCILNECDLYPDSCNKKKLILFRGEDQLYDQTGLSSLIRLKLNHHPYANGLNSIELLNRYSSDLGILRDFDLAPQNEPVVLQDQQWFYFNLTQKVFPYYRNDTRHSSALTSYLFHVEASYPHYKGNDDGVPVKIDPLISTSSNPNVALAFSDPAPGSRGRLIVYSIAEKEFKDLCSVNTVLTPATVLDPRGCDVINEHSEEAEFDLVLNPLPEWVIRSFEIKHLN